MSDDEGNLTPPATDSGGENGSGGEAGGERSDWQAELAARLEAQRARREEERELREGDEPMFDPEAEERTEADMRAELATPTNLAETREQTQLVTELTREGLTPVREAQETWANAAGEFGGLVNDAATLFGEVTATFTSFLAPVPAMLLLFLNYNVPIPIPIPVMYKPETLSWSKKAEWSAPGSHSSSSCAGRMDEQRTPLHNVPQATFKGGGPEKLDLELFFDTTDTQIDVRLLLKPIQALVYIVPLRQEPPLVMFSWGMILSKMSYVEELEIDYTYFRADGTPLRAEVELTLTEYDLGFLSMLPMNPTSYSEARKTWVVTEGQTLDWIAYQEYGSASHWRHIAQVNNLANPRDLRSGQILKLTPLP